MGGGVKNNFLGNPGLTILCSGCDHGFAARASASRGWRASAFAGTCFARHDDGWRPESRDFGLLVLPNIIRVLCVICGSVVLADLTARLLTT